MLVQGGIMPRPIVVLLLILACLLPGALAGAAEHTKMEKYELMLPKISAMDQSRTIDGI